MSPKAGMRHRGELFAAGGMRVKDTHQSKRSFERKQHV